METEDSLPCPQEPATCPYPETVEYSPQFCTHFSSLKHATCLVHLIILNSINPTMVKVKLSLCLTNIKTRSLIN